MPQDNLKAVVCDDKYSTKNYLQKCETNIIDYILKNKHNSSLVVLEAKALASRRLEAKF